MNTDIKFIKFTVYLMGIAMAIGVIVIALTIYKHHLPSGKEILEKNCTMQSIKTSQPIKQATAFENKVMLLTELEANHQEIIIIDYCTGQHITTHKIIITQ